MPSSFSWAWGWRAPKPDYAYLILRQPTFLRSCLRQTERDICRHIQKALQSLSTKATQNNRCKNFCGKNPSSSIKLLNQNLIAKVCKMTIKGVLLKTHLDLFKLNTLYTLLLSPVENYRKRTRNDTELR